MLQGMPVLFVHVECPPIQTAITTDMYLLRLSEAIGVSRGQNGSHVVQLFRLFLQGLVFGAQGIDDNTMRYRSSRLIHIDKGNKPLEKKFVVRAEMNRDI